jgi:hypothetical protein
MNKSAQSDQTANNGRKKYYRGHSKRYNGNHDNYSYNNTDVPKDILDMWVKYLENNPIQPRNWNYSDAQIPQMPSANCSSPSLIEGNEIETCITRIQLLLADYAQLNELCEKTNKQRAKERDQKISEIHEMKQKLRESLKIPDYEPIFSILNLDTVYGNPPRARRIFDEITYRIDGIHNALIEGVKYNPEYRQVAILEFVHGSNLVPSGSTVFWRDEMVNCDHIALMYQKYNTAVENLKDTGCYEYTSKKECDFDAMFVNKLLRLTGYNVAITKKSRTNYSTIDIGLDVPNFDLPDDFRNLEDLNEDFGDSHNYRDNTSYVSFSDGQKNVIQSHADHIAAHNKVIVDMYTHIQTLTTVLRSVIDAVDGKTVITSHDEYFVHTITEIID